MYRVGKAAHSHLVLVAIAGLLALTGLVGTALADKRQKPLLDLGKQDDGSAVELRLTVDKARTVACDREFIELLVANPSIADVVRLLIRQVYVLWRSAGITHS